MVRPHFKDVLQKQGSLDRITVGELMTPNPLTLQADARLSEAVEIMETRGIMHMPVVEDGKLVGLLSERHIRDAMPSLLLLSEEDDRRRSLKLVRVSKVMITEVSTVSPDTPLLTAIRTMRDHKAGSLPVVERGKLVGILTGGDLITLLEDILRHSMQSGLRRLASGDHVN